MNVELSSEELETLKSLLELDMDKMGFEEDEVEHLNNIYKKLL